MEPFDRMPLSDLRRVLRVAARIQSREQAAEEEARLREEYLRAAAEVGLTEDHLRRALAEMRARRSRRAPHPLRTMSLASLAGLVSVTGFLWWTASRVLDMPPYAEPAQVATVVAGEPAPQLDTASTLDLWDRDAYRCKASGFKYRIIHPGSGRAASPGQTLEVHYTGWLESDGTKFDSSVDRGELFSFELGRDSCIPGFEQGIEGMRIGEKRRLVIPPDLGYGPAGVPGGAIPPDATLLFDVELVAIRDRAGM